MLLGEILVAHGLVGPDDIEHAFERQKKFGGRLGDNLVAMGLLAPEQLQDVLNESPAAIKTIEDTGISTASLLKLLMKNMYVGSLETPTDLAEEMRLPYGLVDTLLEEAADRKLVEILGTSALTSVSEFRYTMTSGGREFANEALSQSQYVGAAPVPLSAFHDQIHKQRITNERIDRTMIDEAFANLVISEDMIRNLGPGINSGRAILLYGPPGNGKTSIAEKVGSIFQDVIYIPHCIEVEGQNIKVFDPSIHEEVDQPSSALVRESSVRREEIDKRWVACRRPIIIVGGELTLEMLDLNFNDVSMFYEAPMHVKALGGTFIIDDFGRQIVSPKELLNRWIVPLESRVDYLKLHTGKSFSLPFDELVIFSTNMTPEDLMDPAFLRRIPYKMEIGGPILEDYRKIFAGIAAKQGVELTDEIFDFVVEELQVKNDFPLACYQPKFIIDQVISACKYDGVAPILSRDLVLNALGNLYTRTTRERAHQDAPTAASAGMDAAA